MKKLTCLLLACLTALSLTACGAPKTETLDIFAMDTYMSLVAIGDGGAAVLQSCSNEINALEQKLSRTIDTSDVAQLNANGTAQLSGDTAALLRSALQYSAETDGAFDVTIAPLVALWGITTDSPRVPAQEEIDALLPLVGSGHVRLDGTAAALDETPERKLDRIIYIAAMNFKAEGGGVPMAPKADATDGKLSICSVHGIPKWRTFLCLPFLVAAKHTGIRGFDIDDCGTCEVRLKDPMVLHADGEYCGDVTKLQFRCLPGMLRVLL